MWHPGQVFSREQLLQQLSDDPFVGGHVLGYISGSEPALANALLLLGRTTMVLATTLVAIALLSRPIMPPGRRKDSSLDFSE